jgi:hypothetical protein
MKRPLSLRAYARHRRQQGLPGATLRAVAEAAAAGRIDVGPGQTIADPVATDLAWAERTDHAKRPPSTNGHGRRAGAGTLQEARRLEAIERSRGLKLVNDRLAGTLVEAAAVERMYSGMVVEARNALRGIPSKAKQRIPHLTAADLTALAALIDECLESLADDRRDGKGDGA